MIIRANRMPPAGTAHIRTPKWKGSFTIEAAVVVPMIMLVLMAIIYLTFFVYDKITVTAATEYAVLEHAEDSLMGAAFSSGMEGGLEQRLAGASGASLSVSGIADHCEGSGSASFHVPLLMIDQLTSGQLRSVQASVEGNAFDGRKKLLLYKSICDGVSDVLGKGR